MIVTVSVATNLPSETLQILIVLDASEDSEDNVMDKENALLASGVGSGETQVTGRIVTIIRRKWRQYCGIIKKNDFLDVCTLVQFVHLIY